MRVDVQDIRDPLDAGGNAGIVHGFGFHHHHARFRELRAGFFLQGAGAGEHHVRFQREHGFDVRIRVSAHHRGVFQRFRGIIGIGIHALHQIARAQRVEDFRVARREGDHHVRLLFNGNGVAVHIFRGERIGGFGQCRAGERER